jgi:hypothetical protein
MNFRHQAVAAVLSNPETKTAFLEKLAYESPIACQQFKEQVKGLSISSAGGGTSYKYSYYTGKSATDQLSSLSVKGRGNQASAAPGQLTLLSYNGSEWSGFLVEAGPYVKYLAPGFLVTPLVQALFGTKTGTLMLPALLLLLL